MSDTQTMFVTHAFHLLVSLPTRDPTFDARTAPVALFYAVGTFAVYRLVSKRSSVVCSAVLAVRKLTSLAISSNSLEMDNNSRVCATIVLLSNVWLAANA